MVKVRLKEGVGFSKMNTPYGLITHEWSIVRDDAYIYKEMEVDEFSKPVIQVVDTPGPELVIDPKPIIDPKPKPVIDPKPKVIVKKPRKISVKKKSSRRRK